MVSDGGRVALVLGSTSGGVGWYVRTMVAGLTERAVAVDVYCPVAAATEFDFAARGAAVTTLEFAPSAGPAGVGPSVRLRRALRAEPVDVVHAHGLRAGLLASLARPERVPLVVNWYGVPAGRGVRRFAEVTLARAVARAADVTLAGLPEVAEAATRLGARDVRPSPVIAPMLAAPVQSRAEIAADLGISPDAPIVLAVGRLHPQKRHDVLVAAAARWRDRRPVPSVVIAGSGPQYRNLVGQVAVTRAPVSLIGQRADVADLLRAADLAVVTSDGEGSPMVVRECLASGVPLIVSGTTGVAALVGDAAVIVPAGDVDALDAAVRALLDDPGRAMALAAAGVARARTWASVDQAVEWVMAIYAELTSVSAAGSAGG